MTQFIIDEKELKRACDQMTAGGYGVSANYIDAMVRSNPYNPQAERDVKELFRDEIAKWKDEDPLFMAYVYGQEAGKKEELEKVLDVFENLHYASTPRGYMIFHDKIAEETRLMDIDFDRQEITLIKSKKLRQNDLDENERLLNIMEEASIAAARGDGFVAYNILSKELLKYNIINSKHKLRQEGKDGEP